KARRDEWIENLDLSFYVHRSFSLVVLVVHLGLIYFLQKFEGKTGNIRYWTYVLVGILILEILSGAAMAYFAIPAFIQPIHLILASLAFGAQLILWLHLGYLSKVKS
ncbi:MAG: COX15/CtaA family protein, partial [Bacteroidota bacterium]